MSYTLIPIAWQQEVRDYSFMIMTADTHATGIYHGTGLKGVYEATKL